MEQNGMGAGGEGLEYPFQTETDRWVDKELKELSKEMEEEFSAETEKLLLESEPAAKNSPPPKKSKPPESESEDEKDSDEEYAPGSDDEYAPDEDEEDDESDLDSEEERMKLPPKKRNTSYSEIGKRVTELLEEQFSSGESEGEDVKEHVSKPTEKSASETKEVLEREEEKNPTLASEGTTQEEQNSLPKENSSIEIEKNDSAVIELKQTGFENILNWNEPKHAPDNGHDPPTDAVSEQHAQDKCATEHLDLKSGEILVTGEEEKEPPKIVVLETCAPGSEDNDSCPDSRPCSPTEPKNIADATESSKQKEEYVDQDPHLRVCLPNWLQDEILCAKFGLPRNLPRLDIQPLYRDFRKRRRKKRKKDKIKVVGILDRKKKKNRGSSSYRYHRQLRLDDQPRPPPVPPPPPIQIKEEPLDEDELQAVAAEDSMDQWDMGDNGHDDYDDYGGGGMSGGEDAVMKNVKEEHQLLVPKEEPVDADWEDSPLRSGLRKRKRRAFVPKTEEPGDFDWNPNGVKVKRKVGRPRKVRPDIEEINRGKIKVRRDREKICTRQRCKDCGKLFLTKAPYLRHLWLHENNEFVCRYQFCAFATNDLDAHKFHFLSNHANKQAKTADCSHCKKLKVPVAQLEDHLLNVHKDEGPYSCRYCPTRPFYRVSELGYHQQQRHHPASCGECSRKFENGELLSNHLLKVHKKAPLSNRHAQIGLREAADADLPLKDFAGLEDRFVAKEFCVNAERNASVYICRVCGISSKSYIHFRNHRFRHDQKKFKYSIGGELIYSCPDCSEVTDQYGEHLVKHLKLDHGREAPFTCSAGSCGNSSNPEGGEEAEKKDERVFNTFESYLYHHRMEHIPTTCEDCGMETPSHSILIRHRYTHPAMNKRLKKLNGTGEDNEEEEEDGKEGEEDVEDDAIASEDDLDQVKKKKKKKVPKVKSGDKYKFNCYACPYVAVKRENVRKHVATNHGKQKCERICEECGELSTTEVGFFEHMAKHFLYNKGLRGVLNGPRSGQRNKCPYCDFHCADRKEKKGVLEQHISDAHQKKAPYPCPEPDCDKVCFKPGGLTQHMNVHVQITCEICGESMRLSDKTKHMTMKHFDDPNSDKSASKNKGSCVCPYCDYKAQNDVGFRHEIVKHIKDVHDKGAPFPCAHCPRRFPCPENLVYHNKCHVPVMCEVCGLSVTQAQIKRHMQIEHPETQEAARKERGAYKCKVPGCDFVSTAYHHVYHRKSVHQNIKRLFCRPCHLYFNTKEDYIKHWEDSHDGQNPLVCKDCNIEFDTTKKLTVHRHREHGEALKPLHTCKQLDCGQSFMTMAKLKEHLLETHADTLDIRRCHVLGCSYWGMNKKQIVGHMVKIHHGLDSFNCDDCDYVINEQCTFIHHCQTEHDNDRPFKCEQCPFRSLTPQMVGLHATQMHGANGKSRDLLYQCLYQECGRKFAAKGHIHKHMKEHFGDTGVRPKGMVGRCASCYMYFADDAEYEAHESALPCFIGADCKRPLERRYYCDACGKKFQSKRQLEDHHDK